MFFALVEFFKQIIFSNLFLKTPTFHGRMDGRSCSCMLYSENHLNLNMIGRIGNMSYTFDIIVVSIGIIGFFQLVSILTFLVYSYNVFVYVCFQFLWYQFQLLSIYSYIYKKIWVYKNVNTDTNWMNPMIPIETTIISSVYLI